MIFLETISEGNEKKTTHKSANFQIVTCNLLTFSHLHPVAARGMPGDSSGNQEWAALRNQGVIFFSMICLVLTLKKFWDENCYDKVAVLSGVFEISMGAEMQAFLGSSSWCDDWKNVGKGFSSIKCYFCRKNLERGEGKGCGKGTYSSCSKQFSFRTYEKVTKVKMTSLNEKQVFFL